jgi:hypothetical protein
MKIFSPPESNAPKEGTKAKKVSGKKAALPQKKIINENEIREKLAGHTQLSNTAKSKIIQKNSQALGAGFMNEDVKPELVKPSEIDQEDRSDEKAKSLKESHLLLSDVKLNDPNDSNTQEKLKNVLKMGAFNFNPKEKEALEKILGN